MGSNSSDKQGLRYAVGKSSSAAGGGRGGEDGRSCHDHQQDGFLPIANVGRIMKQILPPNAKISKEAKETMQECVSEMISFVTGEASDKCNKEKRKTVHGDDVCWAFANLGFDDYIEPLKKYLQKYRDMEAGHDQKGNKHKASASGSASNYEP